MNKQAILQYIDQKFHIAKTLPDFRVGDTVRVHVKITEGDSTRVQIFEGVVISFSGTMGARNFTARKISFGVGVERVFPLNSPAVEKIEIMRSGHVRRAKLYYLRDRVGKAAKLEDRDAVNNDLKKAIESKKAVSPSAAPQKELAAVKEK